MYRAVFVVIVLATIILTIKACPNIKTKSESGGRLPQHKTLIADNLTYVIIHHTDTPQCNTEEACAKRVKSIQNYHMDEKHWDDIGYNFLVDQFGNIYEGRGFLYQGAHAPKYNDKSIGIAVIGTYNYTVPSAEALASTENLIACGVMLGKIKEQYKLLGHRQVRSTDCPGDQFYELIKTWPHWSQHT